MRTENAYVLGTHDEEIARLGLQHRAWRPYVLAAWQAAGIRAGHTVLDVGCGPGYASLDLAETVGPEGRVVAIDKSPRFLNVLASRGAANIETIEADLEAREFPDVRADRAWCRWVLCFVRNPREVLAMMAGALAPGGVIVLHEYFDYAAWRAAPDSPELDEYVNAVMKSWRDAGGEPDIARQIPHWLEELGFTLRETRPIVELVQPGSGLWAWVRSFAEVGRHRLCELGYLTPGRSERIGEALAALECAPGSRMFTPGVLQIVASR